MLIKIMERGVFESYPLNEIKILKQVMGKNLACKYV